MVLGNFNLIWKAENRNRDCVDLNDMFLLNEAISVLGLTEITLQGRMFTWSNMESSSLLVKLEWVFTSNSWTISHPKIIAGAMEMTPSDHCPFVVNISTNIPNGRIFRFENLWLQHDKFRKF